MSLTLLAKQQRSNADWYSVPDGIEQRCWCRLKSDAFGTWSQQPKHSPQQASIDTRISEPFRSTCSANAQRVRALAERV
jgi:hypothetical protein